MTDSATANSRPHKPFCSLAYLAKSTVAVGGGHTNGHLQNGSNANSGGSLPQKPNSPSVAATAKVTERASPDLPVGAMGEGGCTTNGGDTVSINSATATATAIAIAPKNGASDIFGEINEEEVMSRDQIDGELDPRRPWELSTSCPPSSTMAGEQHENGDLNGGHILRRIPSALVPNIVGPGGMNSLAARRLDSLDCWDYTIELECLKGPQDLQLAAELGKTLLERNKELETLLKEHKATIEEQEQEIVYLKKHTTALREVNDSRLKVYEQLEVGIQDLERANHRLILENNTDKKNIKTLQHTADTFEGRCDELNKQLEESRQLLSMERRKSERLLQERNNAGAGGETVARPLRPTETKMMGNNVSGSSEGGFESNANASENCSFAFLSSSDASHKDQANSTGISGTSGGVLSISSEGGVGVAGTSMEFSFLANGEDNEELLKLVHDLEAMKRAFTAEQQRCGELEEQLMAIIQENQTLQGRLAQTSTNEEMRSMHDELSILDEVRQGQMCSRCLRSLEDRATINDEQSSIAPTEEADDDEDDERSLLDLDSNRGGEDNDSEYRSSIKVSMSRPSLPGSLDLNVTSTSCASPNPYRDLVAKYEALLEVQRSSVLRKTTESGGGVGGGLPVSGLSLADEFQSCGDFKRSQQQFMAAIEHHHQHQHQHDRSNGSVADVDCQLASSNNSNSNSNIHNDNDNTNTNKGSSMKGGRTPTEFSEAETSSSGYSDETSNKCTQTDDRPGYFLCSIGDGEDCKFSIYDDVSPIDSRFRNRPEYRELFKEIFAVLKKAAENKEEGDKLPLLDDTHPVTIAPTVAGGVGGGGVSKVPPVTPANEELPGMMMMTMDDGGDYGADDAQSIISSAVSEQSFAMSECVTKLERRTAKKHIHEAARNQENQPPAESLVQLTAAVGTPAAVAAVAAAMACPPPSSLSATSSSTAAMAGIGSASNAGTTAGTIVGTQKMTENGRILTPLKREPLEYLSIGVGIKKKNRKKNRNFSNDRAESPVALPSPPRFYITTGGGSGGSGGRSRRKDIRPFVESPLGMEQPSPRGREARRAAAAAAGGTASSTGGAKFEWNGNSMIIYNRGVNSPHRGHATAAGVRAHDRADLDLGGGGMEYRPSTVSQDLHKLKKLDLSYAEVLRRADACKHHHQSGNGGNGGAGFSGFQQNTLRRRHHHH